MTAGSEGGLEPGQAQPGGGYRVDARGASGVQVGEGNVQIVYSYSGLTSTDGIALPPLAGVSGAVVSPYRGLGAFEERDAAFFFGREDATAEVLRRMSGAAAGDLGVVVVSGASGAGKSSLLRAGVLPRLRGAGLGGVPEAAAWPCAVFAPGRSPLDELAVRVALLAGADAGEVRRGLAAGPEGFALTARQAALARPDGPVPVLGDTAGEPGRKRLLLVVDQFEQVFTRCEDERERRAFIAALCAAADPGRAGAPGALVVLGLRADFEVRCAAYPELAGAVQDRYLLPAMTARQLRTAITGPATAVNSRVDDELARVLLDEVRARQTGDAGAGVLPLLSHALDQAWRSRTGKDLTLADYERVGGIEAAVAASAERAYTQLTPDQRETARQVFTRLTAVGPDGTDTADRATRAELTAGKTPERAADVEAVLEAFAAERLVTLAADSVEISHEALLTAWPLLRDTWLAQTHADRITRTRLRAAAAEWQHSRDPAYLYRGTLLQASETAWRTAADPGLPLGPAERDFLRASTSARRRAAHWRQAAVSVLAALSLVATATAFIAVSNAATASRNAGIASRDAARADQQQAIALSRQLAADSLATDPATGGFTARQFAVAAWSVYPTAQAGSALTTLLAQQQQQGIIYVDAIAPFPGDGIVTGVAFSPDGRLLATADEDGTARLWNVSTGQPVGSPLPADPGPAGGVNAVAFSPDGRLLATADEDGTARLWNVSTGQPVGSPLPADPGGFVNAVAFSPDGRLLATADTDGTARLWNVSTGQPVGSPLPADPGPAGGVNAVAFSPDGRLLATADEDGTARLWNVSTGQPVGSPLPADSPVPADPGFDSSVSGVAFSPDGRLLATVDMDGAARLWNVSTGQPVGSPLFSVFGGYLNAVAFSPDGRLLATAGGSGTARLWNVSTGQPVGSPLPADPGPAGGVNAVAFSPDGRLLATADGNGTARLWNVSTGQPVGSPLPADPGGFVNAVAFSPDGELLATADNNGTAGLWRIPLFTDAYQTLCTEVGPPTRQEWEAVAPGEPFPKACA